MEVESEDIWADLHMLAEVAVQHAKIEEELAANKVEKLEKDGLLSWQQKKKRSVLNDYHQQSMIQRNVIVGWNMSGFEVQERKFGGSGEGCSKWNEGFNSAGKTSCDVPSNQARGFMCKGYNKLFEGLNSAVKGSINQVQESTWKKRKHGSGEGCSKRAGGCSSNDQKKSREKKKCLKNVEQLPSPEMPEAFKTAIRDLLNGGNEFTGEIMLVLERNLFMTDTIQVQNRLSIPENQIKREFLKSNEKRFLEEKKDGGKHNYIEVKIIEPLLKQGTLNLRHWKTNSHYVLNGEWHVMVTRNNLEEGDFVQLWAFRIEGNLCFALCTVPSRKIP